MILAISTKMPLQETPPEEERAVIQEKIDCNLKDAKTCHSNQKNDKVNYTILLMKNQSSHRLAKVLN